MENAKRLTYLKHSYKELFADQSRRQWVKHICLEKSYNYLIKRAESAQTEREFDFFKAILNHYIQIWKGNKEEHVLVLYMGEEKELALWMEFELLYVEIPNGEKGDMTAFDLDYSFCKHEITVHGNPYTIENYLNSIGFDYSYSIED